jgi:hypothetical protein
LGAFPAACLALAGPVPGKKQETWIDLTPSLAALAGILATSLFYYYDEIYDTKTQGRMMVSGDFFSGIQASPDDYALTSVVKTKVNPYLDRKNTIAIIGRVPGLAMVTPARLLMASSFPLQASASQKAHAVAHAFYTRPEHRADFVMIYNDPVYGFFNPMGGDFDRWYQLVEDVNLSDRHVLLYRRR